MHASSFCFFTLSAFAQVTQYAIKLYLSGNQVTVVIAHYHKVTGLESQLFTHVGGYTEDY